MVDSRSYDRSKAKAVLVKLSDSYYKVESQI